MFRVVLNLNEGKINVYKELDKATVELIAQADIDIHKCPIIYVREIVEKILDQVFSRDKK